MLIRTESANDAVKIHQLTKSAFDGRPYAGGDEQHVVDRLRAHKALILSLVAIDHDELVGQISFSEATNTDGSQPWIALGPVSVLPTRQRQGIGSRLILQGLEEFAARGTLGCILTGNPDYYRRFGFAVTPDHAPSNEPAEFFMLKLFGEQAPGGRFSFHPLFYGDL